MKKTNTDSKIEIWSDTYINKPEKREPQDQRKMILQIEPGSNARAYIVEVIDPGKGGALDA